MVDFISEVEEELRKDDYNKFLRQYGPWIIGLLVGVVLAVAFFEWREYSNERTAQAAAASYLDADDLLQDGETDRASRAFLELAGVAPDGYAGLSLMRAANIAADNGNAAEAVRLYDLAAERFDLDRHSHLAQIKAAYVLANEEQWSDVDLRAEDLIEEGAPYEFLARELVASAALNQGDTSRAREQFSYLSVIPGVPEAIGARADQALTLLNGADRLAQDTSSDLPAPETITVVDPAADTPSEDEDLQE